MIEVLKKHKTAFLLSIWTVLNLLTAAFSELYTDEAYYWVYTQFPAWGYFDHPPMTAWMIQGGYWLFENEIGVRLIAVLFSTGFIYMLYKLSPQQNDQNLFWFIVFSIFPLHLFGFLAIPDTPFLFFSGLFFYIFKRYLEKDSIQNTLLMGVVIACLFYSKYHAVLLVLFTVLANLSLFKRKSFYGIIVLSVILFLPHIWWQISNDYPTLQFHLVDRSSKPYQVSYTIEYILGQLFFYGPLLGGTLLVRALVLKRHSLFDKTLYANLVGVLAFFFIMSFKGSVEVNWTIPIIAPLVVLNLSKPINNLVFSKTIKWLSIVSIVLFLIVRFHISSTLFYFDNDRSNEFKGHQEFADNALKLSQGLPIVANRYQDASVLSFYSKQPFTSLNYNGRYNLFSMLDFADQYDGQKVALVDIKGEDLKAKYHAHNKLSIVDSLTFNRNIHLSIPKSFVYKKGNNRIPVSLLGARLSDFNDATYFKIDFFENNELIIQKAIKLNKYELGTELFLDLTIPKNVKLEHTELKLFFKTDHLGDWAKKTIKYKNK